MLDHLLRHPRRENEAACTADVRSGAVPAALYQVPAALPPPSKRRGVRELSPDPYHEYHGWWALRQYPEVGELPILPASRQRAEDRFVAAMPTLMCWPAPNGRSDLRHSFASLLLHEGRSVIYVARQLGHDARLTLSRYGHVIDELESSPHIDAEAAIRAAREAHVPPSFLAEANA